MVYLEIKERNGRKYYYLTESVRKNKSVKKKRKYLGLNLSKEELDAAKERFVRKRVNLAIEKIKPLIIKILKKEGIKKAGIFGSYARGEQKKNSDVDILVEFNGSLLDLVGLEIELKKILKKKVDLVTYGGGGGFF